MIKKGWPIILLSCLISCNEHKERKEDVLHEPIHFDYRLS
jgi:hypothetical protein